MSKALKPHDKDNKSIEGLAAPTSVVRASHDAQKLARGISSGAFTHATLLSGDELLCKDIFMLACEFKAQNSGIPLADDPDITILNGAALKVEDAEELQEILTAKPFTQRRMVYIAAAGRMSEVVQNKLLKTLEEPPADNQFVLSGADGLLPTIISRCMSVLVPAELQSDRNTLQRMLAECVERDTGEALSPSDAQACLEFTGWNLDGAYAPATDKTIFELYSKAFDWFTGKPPRYLFEMPPEFTQNRESTERVLNLFSLSLCDIIRIKEGASPKAFDGKREDILKSIAAEHSLSELVETFELCIGSLERLFANTPPKQTMDNLYARSVFLNTLK